MCLVFLSFQAKGPDPLMIGANREESRRRPVTSPVCCRQHSVRCLLAGADHGPDGTFPEIGTWLGVNESRLAVAVANRRDGELSWAEQIRSRGLLATRLLGHREPESAARFAGAELARGGYGGCNFLIANPHAAFVVQAPGARQVSIVKLDPGIHAMTNLDLDDDSDPRVRLTRASLEPDDFVVSSRVICSDERIVIAGAERGTVSSSLILSSPEIVLYHVLGIPRGGDYLEYRLPAKP
jgi:uncharacterized protein with NRDE domain